jgi:putative glutamine amidotransferase
MAVSSDALVEALYKPDQRFLWAVQWHPEFSWQTDNNSRKIFGAFVSAARQTPSVF